MPDKHLADLVKLRGQRYRFEVVGFQSAAERWSSRFTTWASAGFVILLNASGTRASSVLAPSYNARVSDRRSERRHARSLSAHDHSTGREDCEARPGSSIKHVAALFGVGRDTMKQVDQWALATSCGSAFY